MNYKLIMTEGSTELAFVNLLLNRGLLVFSKEELLMEQIFHKRQIDGELIGYIQGIPFSDTVDIYRVGDKLTDTLKIPKSILKSKIRNKYKVCTLPEFEILFILYEDLYENYLKFKSQKKPSVYYKEYNTSYKKQSSFITSYFSRLTNNDIICLINLYVDKRSRSHGKDQLTLKVLIKE